MQELEQRRQSLEAEPAASAEPKPRLHPNLADICRHRMKPLNEALEAKDGEEVGEAVHLLTEAIVLMPIDAGWPSRFAATWPGS
jgi:hypothetical protein